MEQQFLEWLRRTVPHNPTLPLALNDDAGLVATTVPPIVATSDLVSDQTDFLVAEHAPEVIGRKALAINLSDLAAMACRPAASLFTIAYPPETSLEYLQRIYAGAMELANQFGAPIAGGDTNQHNGPLVLSVTAFGHPIAGREPLLRSGALVDDRILVTGSLGGSILGHHLNFVPRVETALRLHHDFQLHAGMDISDGLALDASRLAAASRCGIVIDLETVPIAAAARELAANSGRSAQDHALGDGEDFELLLAVPKEEVPRIIASQTETCPITEIGRCIEQPGLWYRDASGCLVPLPPTGYLH